MTIAGLAMSAALAVTACMGSSDTPKGSVDQSDGTTTTSAPATYEPVGEVIVTRPGRDLPTGCEPVEMAGLITNFFQALNRGDVAELSSFIAPQGNAPPRFQWFWVNGAAGTSYGAEDRERFLEQARRRSENGENLQLLVFDIAPSTSVSYGAGVVLTVLRRADDVDPRGEFMLGKAEFDCREQAIFVWAMGAEPRRTAQTVTSQICPLPEGWSLRGPVVVACGRASQRR